MATTVTTADLTVTISENYTLNGVAYGNTVSTVVAEQGQVSQRIMSIAGQGGDGGTYTDILDLKAADGKGTVVVANYGYFRITNLDDTNALNLRLDNGADNLYFLVAAGQSILFMSPDVDAVTPSGGTVAVTFADMSNISGQSSHATDAIDIEFVVVTA